MNKVYKYIGIVLMLLQLGCTDDFDAINSDPTQTGADSYDPNYLLSRAQYEHGNTGYTQLLFQSMWVQSLASTFSYYSNGDKYVGSGSLISYQNRAFDEGYRSATFVHEMKNLVADDDTQSNIYHIGTMMEVMILQRITDCYGDIPYTEALDAKDGIAMPVYDTQETIYHTMLAQLDTAVTSLDNAKAGPTADLFYAGNIDQWRRFGYTLMLRTAMRLTEADPATAQEYAEKAAAGGTFESIADDAVAGTDNSTGMSNDNSNALLVADDYREVKWSETFIDYLASTNDPRLGVISEVPQAGLTNNADQSLSGNSDPSVQLGLPNGYILSTIVNYDRYPGSTGEDGDIAVLGNYSRPTTALYLDRSAPNILMTYGESELLLAEASVRGWNVGDAATHYANGVVGSMQSIATYNAAVGTIDAATANAYVAANPLDMSSTAAAIQLINEQLWVTHSSLFSFIEAWSNWRRSGYPALEPVEYVNQFTDGTIPVRIPYQSNESANNPENYRDAVSRLDNGDSFTSNVWWDVQ